MRMFRWGGGDLVWYAAALHWAKDIMQSGNIAEGAEPRWEGLREILRMAGPVILSNMSWTIM